MRGYIDGKSSSATQDPINADLYTHPRSNVSKLTKNARKKQSVTVEAHPDAIFINEKNLSIFDDEMADSDDD